ncbi:MAG: MBL fold metallo-hydrolase [Prevotellaceae bacterium]|nr:MBL fold metallo-hydrolase [Prevotellaceae bacterium]
MIKKIIFTICAVAVFAACSLANKKEKTEQQQNPIGEYKIFVLNDVAREGNPDILIAVAADTVEKYRPEGGYLSAINAFLVQRGDSNILFDTGIGQKLVENLNTYGVAPENVHTIFITHCHGDHIGGLLANDKALFINAKLYINRIEYDYWLKEQNALFLKVIDRYKTQLEIFDIQEAEKTLLPDIQAVAAYGHTPGHTMYLLGNSAKTLIWGDIMHLLPIQFAHPEYSVTYDVNPEEAALTRFKAITYAIKNDAQIAGMHIPNSGFVGKLKAIQPEKSWTFEYLEK